MGGEIRILIVDDDSILAEYIALILARQGDQLAGIVGSGEEAVASALAGRPDLVLMDVKINGRFDGIAAAARIKERADIPIIYLTAYRGRAVKAKAEETEPSGYLLKPFKSAVLIDMIETALGDRGSTAPGNKSF